MATITAEELRAMGETQTLEFKRSLSLTREGFESLCAMVNSNEARGVVTFGVEPDGTIVGLGDTNLDSAQQSLANHATQKFDPRLQPTIQAFQCEGLPVLVMSAVRARGTPYHEYDGRAFIRVGSVTRQLQLTEKQQLSLSRNRDTHNGPWRCDKCGAFAGMVSSVAMTAAGPRKVYTHSCGGEWWPAT